MEVPDETPWACHTCGARAYDLEGRGINPDHTLYCEQCEAKMPVDTYTREDLARVWREGYLQGADDERYASEVDVREFGVQIGPNRANPYGRDARDAR